MHLTWAQAGFVDRSSAIPDSQAGRHRLLRALEAYFAANPTHEVVAQGITSVRAGELAAELEGKHAAVDAARSAATAAKQGRDAAVLALCRAMRALLEILGMLLDAKDSRWAAFGLLEPAADRAPGQPQQMATMDAHGAIEAACKPTPLATRYRWRVKVPGVDVDYRLVASTIAPQALMESAGAWPGAELIVQAVNGRAQGSASVPVVIERAPQKPVSSPALQSTVEAQPASIAEWRSHGASIASRLVWGSTSAGTASR